MYGILYSGSQNPLHKDAEKIVEKIKEVINLIMCLQTIFKNYSTKPG